MARFTDIPTPARVVGLSLLAPLAAGTVAVWTLEAPWRWGALDVQIYAACVGLAFLGATHWGRALAGGGLSWRPVAWSVVPALIAWVAALVKPDLGLILLIAGYLATHLVDRAAVANGWLPDWYGVLRRYQSAGAVLCLGSSLLAAMGG